MTITIRESIEKLYDFMTEVDPYEAMDNEDTREASIDSAVKSLEENDVMAIAGLVARVLNATEDNDQYLQQGYKVLSDMFLALAQN